MPTSDELNSWIQAVAVDADRQAFAALFKHFAPRVKGFLMRAGAPAELAEELAQETMVSVWRKAAGFDPARAGLSTWIFTIARNLRIDQHRRGHGVMMAELEDAEREADLKSADARETPDELMLTAQREQGIRRALAELPPDQALVLRLSFYEDHPHARIAQDLGIPLGTVKSRIRLAVGHLRGLLGRFEP